MNTLRGGGRLNPGQQLRSNNGRYTLIMQRDGNLVLYERGGRAVWDTGTWGGPPETLPIRAEMQHDGNFVLYDAVNEPRWDSGTWNNAGSRIVLQDDRNLVIYNRNNQALWDSGTWV